MKLLSLQDLKVKGIGLCHSQIYRLISKGTFPKPIKIGERRNAWIESEIDDWIKQKIAERDAGQ